MLTILYICIHILTIRYDLPRCFFTVQFMAHSSGGAIQGISQNVVKQLILHPFDTAGTG